MEKQAEVLKNNPHYLKSCILYDVLQKKTVSASYDNFCSGIGDDVMDFFDFQYWFYRFHNGDLDFDHDRSQDPKQKTFVELPVEILSRIAGELTPMERVNLRQMNRALRKVCNMHPPKFENVEIRNNVYFFTLCLDKFNITYKPAGNNSYKVKRNLIEREQQEGDFSEAGLNKLKQIFAIPNMEIQTLNVEEEMYDAKVSLSTVVPPRQLHVKAVNVPYLRGTTSSHTLAWLQPGVLEKICLKWFLNSQDLAIIESPQFQQAKHVAMANIVDGLLSIDQLMNYRHLNTFEVWVETMTAENIVRIRDMLSNSDVFQSCVLKCHGVNLPEIGRALGANVPEGNPYYLTCHCRIEGSEEFLEFNVSSVTKSKIEIKKVH